MGFQLSPGVLVNEVDLTTIVPSVSTTNGAYVGMFRWGPANLRVLVNSEINLVSRFGKPDSNTFSHFFTAANFLAYGNNLRVVRAVGANANNATTSGTGVQIANEEVYTNTYFNGAVTTYGAFAGRYPGELGNSLTVAICASANGWSQNVSAAASIYANTTSGSTIVEFRSVGNTANANAAGYVAVGDLITVGTLETVRVVALSSNGTLATVNAAMSATQNGAGAGAVLTRDWYWKSYFPGAPGTSSYAASLGASNDELHLIVIDEQGKFSTSGTGANTVLETYPYLSKGLDARNDDGSTNFWRNVIFNRSQYIHWLTNPVASTNWGNTTPGTTFTNTNLNLNLKLSGGVTEAPTDANICQGWDLFATPEEVDISLCLGGPASNTVAAYIINNITTIRKDCVAFISPRQSDVVLQPNAEVTNITAFRNMLPSTSYAVLDSGWKYQFDKYNNLYRWVPLNGDIAGLCVRTDTTNDPWWSPAGFNRGSIKNVVKLAWVPNQTERDTIYSIGVNPVVSFAGQGTILYGDKTMQTKPSAFDRINVRRLFIVLEKAIATAAKYSLFEFNDEFTRAQFVNLIEPFLREVQGRRGIYDFKVVCDTTNNTPEVIDSNQFIGDIYIKPARSINFIQLNFVAVRTGVSFDEVVGRF